MLNKLSLRNAERQVREYILYFVTLSCTATFMYAFNALIFSDIVKELSSLEILPYMIIAASLLIVIVMGWVVSYMTRYILRKRSQEFSVYMLLGIPNRVVNTLISRENIFIGLLAFLIGLPIGILLSQILRFIVFHMFGRKYILSCQFSMPAAGLTFFYFFMMLWGSLQKNKKWVKKLKLYDLLYFDRKSEKKILHKNVSTIIMCIISLLLGGMGIILMYIQPVGNGLDVLIGTVFLIIFLFGFFQSVPAYLIIKVGDCSAWKYKKNRLIPFRGFTAKIQSMTIMMGMLSVLFMLAIAFSGIGITVNTIASKNLELNPFDIMVLHNKELIDFSFYEKLFKSNFSVRDSYSYGIYTDSKNDFLVIRDNIIVDSGRKSDLEYAEFRCDTYMRQSDYMELRKVLELDVVELNSNYCYIHCLPALEKKFREYIKEQGKKLKYEGYFFAEEGTFTEPFCQVEAYGNGLDYIIIVPDQAIQEMKVLYSLYVAVTDTLPDSYDLNKIIDDCDKIVKLDRSIGKTDSTSNGYTSLTTNKDYLLGKWVEKGSLSHLYAMSICLFYLAFLLEIIGAAILATHILGDREKRWKQDSILQKLGMENQIIDKVKKRQLFFLFMMPAFLAIIIASCYIYVCAEQIYISAFHLPIFEDNVWISYSLVCSISFFVLIYLIYYTVTWINYRKS